MGFHEPAWQRKKGRLFASAKPPSLDPLSARATQARVSPGIRMLYIGVTRKSICTSCNRSCSLIRLISCCFSSLRSSQFYFHGPAAQVRVMLLPCLLVLYFVLFSNYDEANEIRIKLNKH